MRRQQPGKLDFLGVNGVKENSKQPVSTQFSNELAETLKRSNLRKRTESVVTRRKRNKYCCLIVAVLGKPSSSKQRRNFATNERIRPNIIEQQPKQKPGQIHKRPVQQ